MPERPEPPRVVVGAAIVRSSASGDREVLVAHRPTASGRPGGWEFPGGKVEPGESAAEALVREVAEELGCRVRVRRWLHGQVAIDPHGTMVLRVALAELVAGVPDPVEHDELRWLAGDGLDAVGWLGADRPFLPELAEILGP